MRILPSYMLLLVIWAAQVEGQTEPDRSMPGMNMKESRPTLPFVHSGSGTSWEPASAPSHEWMLTRDGWTLMAHGVIFADYNQQGGPRGVGKAESVNWGMFVEQHSFG